MSVASAKALFADSDAYKGDTNDDGISPYLLERRRFYTDEGWSTLLHQLSTTRTLYVGNLSFFTTEEQMFELFGRIGHLHRLIIGLNKLDKTPCGFAFLEYDTHEDARSCQRFMSSNCSIDERVFRSDLDPGFEEGRQYGRSRKSGGQRRDDYRAEFDPGRGGWAPPPQTDVYLPLYQDHPVGTTTVKVVDGAENIPGIASEEARARASNRTRSRSTSRERQRQRSRSRSREERRRRRRDEEDDERSRSRSPQRRRLSPERNDTTAAAEDTPMAE